MPGTHKEPLIKVYITLFFLLFSFSSSTYAAIDRLSLIKARGKVIIGVKNDYKPWSYIHSDNKLVGFEVDLAKLIANELGVELELSIVNSSNRTNKLLAGEIDIILATMADTIDRRKLMGIISPGYFGSGVNLLTTKKDIKQWNHLAGRKICLIKDAFFNNDLIQQYFFTPVEFKGKEEVLQSMKNGSCDGWLYDDSALFQTQKSAKNQSLRIAFDSIKFTPWVIAVKPDEKILPLGKALQSLLINWHQQGTLIKYEKLNELPASKFLKSMQQRWNSNECNQLNAASEHSYSCQGHNHPLKDIHNNQLIFGIDMPLIYDSYSRQQVAKAIGITFALSFFSILGSLSIGLILAYLLIKSPKWLVAPFWLVVYVFRMVPPILNLYIVYFGIGGIIASQFGMTLNTFWIATLILSLYAGTSNAMMLRHAYTSSGTFKLAIIKAYDNLMSNSVNIVKASGIASTIALAEIISVTKSIIVEFGQDMLMMSCLLAFYYLLVSSLIYILNLTRYWVIKWK